MFEEALFQLECARQRQDMGNAGACSLAREDAQWGRLQTWLRACRECPSDPGGRVAAVRKEKLPTKCGM
eukprot:1340447-Pyramimonas_sp.AAC.1